MTEEKKFPIYSFSARWSEDGIQDPNRPKWYEGLPEGRVWNSTGFSKMFREEQTQEQLDTFINDWWGKYIESQSVENIQKHRHPIINPQLAELKHSYKHHETWVLTWFSHETFDLGQTDGEALQSFENYVRRIEELNLGKEIFDQICLMGAEDRWRWHGSDPDGKPNQDVPPPCRCKYCKEQGLIRIGH